MKQTKSPFAKKLTAEAARQVVFVRPELVAEVEFRAWTADGSVRHAAYRGLRDDKAPEEVVRESATAAKGKAAGTAAPAIRLTHPDLLYWNDAGRTKKGLPEYYSEVWQPIAPFLLNTTLAHPPSPAPHGRTSFFTTHPRA